ncbi:MAG TPA: hypothetical protein VGM17_07340 [Rhizomicrobium sp.]
MPTVNPEHLFEQAEQLSSSQHAGPPKQADLRRAISAAYYGVFHFIMTEAADRWVGKTKRNTTEYGRVYRSVNHKALWDLCDDLKKPTLPTKYKAHVPTTGIGPNIAAFAAAVVELQEKRHTADYDPLARIKLSDAQLAVKAARAAVRRFKKASKSRRVAFPSLLVFPPRR